MGGIEDRGLSMATSLGRPPDGGPYGLAHGARLDQKTFHERYERTPHGFHAELIDLAGVLPDLELECPHVRDRP